MISGLAALTGYRGMGPAEAGISYGDPNGGLHGAFAILAALWHRRTSARGQYVDVAQFDALVAVLPEGVLPYTMRGEQLPRDGNRDRLMVPHGIFRCAGDRWVSVAVRNDEEWRRMAGIIDPALVDDPRFATQTARKANEDALEALVTAWSESRDRWEVTELLQGEGIAAAPVFDTKDVAEDEHMCARDYFVWLEHPEVGVRQHAGIPWKLHGTPLRVRRAGPCMGEHTAYVVKDLLGRPDEEYDRLAAAGVLN
jgi:crotonobetainyl-CoA:carnitine CoA-transferase CaiB-like acyl-CoA transferase